MIDAVLKLATEMRGCCAIANDIWASGNIPLKTAERRASNDNYLAKPNLNRSQNLAIEHAISSPLMCLWGPPGTGKTTTLVGLITELQITHVGQRILVTAPTHNAVDNVMRKYLEVSDSQQNMRMSCAPLRVSTSVGRVAPDLRKHTCDAMYGKEIHTSETSRKQARDKVKSSRIIFTTCIGAGLGLLRSEKFDIVIIDEASQLTEAASLVPLVKDCHKAILVGDHVQLRATVQKHAALQDFDISLFERLYRAKNEVDTVTRIMLDTQYRMHPSICKFSSEEFYGSNLRTGISSTSRPLSVSQFPWPQHSLSTPSTGASVVQDKSRMILIECSSPEDLGWKSKSNQGQVDLCFKLCQKLCGESTNAKSSQTSTKRQTIAVLTLYSRQAELLKTKISQFDNFEVSSIDGFQGREADIVIFVTVRCNAHCDIGFLKDMRRLNVALTRARAAVIVIGHLPTLTMGDTDPESTAVWKRLLNTLIKVKLEDGK